MKRPVLNKPVDRVRLSKPKPEWPDLPAITMPSARTLEDYRREAGTLRRQADMHPNFGFSIYFNHASDMIDELLDRLEGTYQED